MYEELEDAKWAIRGNKSKDRQYNGQNKKQKKGQNIINKILYSIHKFENYEPH